MNAFQIGSGVWYPLQERLKLFARKPITPATVLYLLLHCAGPYLAGTPMYYVTSLKCQAPVTDTVVGRERRFRMRTPFLGKITKHHMIARLGRLVGRAVSTLKPAVGQALFHGVLLCSGCSVS